MRDVLWSLVQFLAEIPVVFRAVCFHLVCSVKQRKTKRPMETEPPLSISRGLFSDNSRKTCIAVVCNVNDLLLCFM